MVHNLSHLPFRLLLHGGALYSCYYAFTSINTIVQITGAPINKEYGGRFQFLTICGLTLTTVTMALSLFADLVPSFPVVILKEVFSSVAMPAETLISILYWGLLSINPQLIMPPKQIYDPHNPGQILPTEPIIIPFSIDDSLHALPGVFLLLDYLLFSRPFPPSLNPGLLCVAATISYATWAEHCSKMNGHFAYPLLDIFTKPQRMLLYAACTLVCYGVLGVCERLHRNIDSTLS